MHGRSLLAQMMILVMLVLVMPAAVVTSYNLYRTLSYAETEIAASAVSQLESVSSTNEMVLFNLVKSTLRLVQSGTFKQIRGMESYDELNDGYENISKAMKLQNLFDELLMNEEGVHSAYFILEDSDYVVSSDKGISRLEEYRPQKWLEDVLANLDSLSGIWVAREMPLITQQKKSSGTQNIPVIPVLSYVYTLKTLDSSIKGTVVVNVYVDDVYSYLNPVESTDTSETLLVDETGMIVVAEEEGQLYSKINGTSYYKKIQDEGKDEGYFYLEENGERYLYVYHQTNFAHWTYISKNNVSNMMVQVKRNHYQAILLIGSTTLIGGIIIYLLMARTLRPVKALVEAVKGDNESLPQERNELLIIAKAFDNMKEKGNTLSRILENKESDALRLALRDSLKGDTMTSEAEGMIQEAIPYHHIMVAFFGVDHQQSYYRELNEDERKFYRYQIVRIIEEVLREKQVQGRAVRHADTISAAIMSFETYDRHHTNKLVIDICQMIQKRIGKELKGTVTIGLSSIHSGKKAIVECANEAQTAYRHKLTLGTDRIISWKEYMSVEDQFFYPYNKEEKILNFVKLRDKKGVAGELEAIRDHVVRHADLSIGNILFIYNQLAGTILRYLAEQQLNTDPIFDECGYIYEKIANLETIEEIEKALKDFSTAAIDYLDTLEDGSDQGHYQRIIQYIEQHYQENIDFEVMGETLGISYSYMRKIIHNTMDKSLLDCLNSIRIEKAKEIMAGDMGSNLIDIATEVGYANAQSFNRYFKKYEGITPSMYRQLLSEHG